MTIVDSNAVAEFIAQHGRTFRRDFSRRCYEGGPFLIRPIVRTLSPEMWS
jgi:hypothetical protein